LEQNTSFGGADPLTPISNIPTSVARTQSILFVSLSVTLFVAFLSVLGKQWVLYYTRVTTWGNIVDRGKERQVKLTGLQKWGLHLVMESLPVMLQLALLLFGVALVIYLWDLNVSAAEVVLVVTSIGLTFYTCVTVAATIWNDFPFQTPISVLLPKLLPWAKEFAQLSWVWLRCWLRRRATTPLLRIGWVTEDGWLASPLGLVFRRFTGGANARNGVDEDPHNDHTMTLSNPTFWRHDPLFTSPIPNDVASSAGFWLLENSTDFSAASAVAAVFSEFQWPSHHRSTTALIRLRDTYVECFRAPEFKNSARIRALQSAAAYYVLYHTQLVWTTFENLEVEVGKLPPDLPPDLFLHLHNDEWNGDDVFEYLLHIENRSEPGTSARFLSYIAPYWFCGDSDTTIRFRPGRLQTLYELIGVLKESQALNVATLTDCVLCAGAAVDFPLHPEDLIRTNKRCVLFAHMLTAVLIGDSNYLAPTFKMVVEHVHRIVLTRGRRRRHAKTALEILHTLAKETTISLVDAVWVNGLLKSAVNMDDETFTVLLRLSARRKEVSAADTESPPDPEFICAREGDTDQQSPGGAAPREVTPTPEYILFSKIMKNVQTCIEREGGWKDEAVYGGLIAARDTPRLGSFLPEVEFFRTLSGAMEKEEEEVKPFRVRRAAYDVILVAQGEWLKSAVLRPALEDLNFPRKLHSVVIDTEVTDYQCSFLKMMGVLSDDRYWHPYLRKAMDIWLPFRYAGRDQALHILTNVGELLLPASDSSNPPLDKPLEKFVEDEWAGVSGRPLKDLTASRLEPLAEVTKRFKELTFTENDRKVVLGTVERVIPSLERRRDDGYHGPGEDICGLVDDLIGNLQTPIRHSR